MNWVTAQAGISALCVRVPPPGAARNDAAAGPLTCVSTAEERIPVALSALIVKFSDLRNPQARMRALLRNRRKSGSACACGG